MKTRPFAKGRRTAEFRAKGRSCSPSRAFTLIELLYAMALIVLLMAVLSEAFVSGIEAFRQLKGIGDLNEHLRGAAIDLRRDVQDAHFRTEDLARETLRSGSPDLEEAAALRDEFEAIAADAEDLEAKLRVVERQTVNPAARRLLRRTLEELRQVRSGAKMMVALLELIVPPRPPS